MRRRLAAHEARNAELRKVLGASDDEFVEIVSLKLDQLKEANRRRKLLEKQLAEAVGESLSQSVGPLVEAHFEDADMVFLQQIARRFNASSHSGLAVLTASSSKGACFVVAAGGACTADVQEAGRTAADVLGGRGGGSGPLFQGKASSLARRREAVKALGACEIP